MAKVLEDEAAQFIPEETPWVFLFDAADALADLVYYLDEERERG